MSVETECNQSCTGNEAFAIQTCADSVKTTPLNLTQIQRKNGRKRSMPQKNIALDELEKEESEAEEQLVEEERLKSAEEKAKSILEHYRSFMQRATHTIGGENPLLGLKNPKLLKTEVEQVKENGEDKWDLSVKQSNGEDSIAFDPVVNGPINGPNGLIPERTMRQNNWAIKVWRDWALSRNRKPETKSERYPEVSVDIRVADVEEMSYWLPRFIKEVRRKDKKPYPPDTLMQIASGLQRYLRQVSGRSEVNFFDKYSNTFAEFRDALKERSGELSLESQSNKTGKKIQVDNLSDEELWQSGYLDYTTAKGIFHVVFYYNCVEFEVTSMEEHHELKVEQFQVGIDSTSNQEFIQFKRSDQRYYNMSTKQIMRRYATLNDPRCLVKLYKTYLNLVPSTGPFYRRPLQTPENSSPRFSFNPVGINKLRETHKQLFSPDRPACLRQSGKTTTIRHTSHNSNNGNESPTSPSLNQAITNTSQSVYDVLAQRLKIASNLAKAPVDNAVDLSLKSNNGVEDSEEDTANNSDVAKVMERLRMNWQSINQNTYSDSVRSDSEDDEVLTLKVPLSVKYIVIEREGKRQKFSLN